MTNGKVALLAAGAVGIAIAGWYGYGEVQCRNLEEDYLNVLADMRGEAAIGAIVRSDEMDELLERTREFNQRRLEATLTDLYESCGARRARSVTRRGQEMLLGF